MSLRQRAGDALRRTETGRRLAEDRQYRMVSTAALSLLVDVLFTLYHGYLGVTQRALWFLTMCAYYGVLGVLRCSAVQFARKGDKETGRFLMLLAGLLLVMLSLVLGSVVYLSQSRNIAAKYDTIPMIAIATYTFYRITMAILRAVRQRKDATPLLAVLRSIGYADVAAAVLTMQRSMLVSFGSEEAAFTRTMNAASGAVVFLFVLALGIALLVRGSKQERRKEHGKIKTGSGK